MSHAPTTPATTEPDVTRSGQRQPHDERFSALAAAVRDHEARGRELLVGVRAHASSSTVACARSASSSSDPLGRPATSLGSFAQPAPASAGSSPDWAAVARSPWWKCQ